jgi:hypothetical protein
MDMTIDVNAVNFVEHAELLDVVLTKMQPGNILHVDVADTEYAFLKTNDELFYINIDDHIPPMRSGMSSLSSMVTTPMRRRHHEQILRHPKQSMITSTNTIRFSNVSIVQKTWCASQPHLSSDMGTFSSILHIISSQHRHLKSFYIY